MLLNVNWANGMGRANSDWLRTRIPPSNILKRQPVRATLLPCTTWSSIIAKPPKYRYALSLSLTHSSSLKQPIPLFYKDESEEQEEGNDGDEELLKRMEMWLNRAADAGEPNALFEVGFSHLADDKTRKKGLDMLHRAANQNHPDSLFELGRCYDEGMGVTANPEVCV